MLNPPFSDDVRDWTAMNRTQAANQLLALKTRCMALSAEFERIADESDYAGDEPFAKGAAEAALILSRAAFMIAAAADTISPRK